MDFLKFKRNLLADITEKEKFRCQYERTGKVNDLFLGLDEEAYYRQLEIMRQYEAQLQLYEKKKIIYIYMPLFSLPSLFII